MTDYITVRREDIINALGYADCFLQTCSETNERDCMTHMDRLSAALSAEPVGLECPPQYAHPFFVYDFMPQKIMFKSERGDDSMALDVLRVRGWGHLTGQGEAGLKLDGKVAAAIQDSFGRWVAATLTAALSPVKQEPITVKDLNQHFLAQANDSAHNKR